MKRISIVLAVFIILLIVSACGESPKENGQADVSPGAPASASEGQSALTASSDGEIRMLTDVDGIRGNGSPAGYYDFAEGAEGSNNIAYTDYATASRVYLCNRPECLHVDDSCVSWIPSHSQGGIVMSDPTGSRIFYVGGGMAAGSPEAYGIYVMDPDGANRREVCRMESGQSVTGAVASDGRNLYFQRISVDDTGTGVAAELCELELGTGMLRVLTAFENGAGWLVSGFDGKLVVGDYTDTHFVYRTVSPGTGEETEVYRYDYTEGNISAYALGDKLVLMRKTGEGIGDMVAVSLRDGNETTLQTGLPMLAADNASVKGCYGSLMIWDIVGARGEDLVRYAVDVEAGTVTETTLTMINMYGEEAPLWVLADAGDNLLVVTSQEETGTATHYGMEGEAIIAPVYTMFRALISKADYLANRPNYTPITDNVLAG